MSGSASTPAFHVQADVDSTETLLAGFSEFGLAGLTAVDYLVDQLELTEVGHVAADGLPIITPFEAGTPRHHTRLFSHDDLDVTVLVGELFPPKEAAAPLAATLGEWLRGNDVDEVALLSGIPTAHGPDDHRAFYVATEDYRQARLTDVDVPPMGGGFLDGVNAHLLSRALDTKLRAGVFVTPAHAQTPDVEAAIRLLDAVERVYDLGVDTAPLEAFARDISNHYAELAERLAAVPEEARPEDRMYM